jgi:hypothetical protein
MKKVVALVWKTEITTVGDLVRWPSDTPLFTKVGIKFHQQVAVAQSVKFPRGLRAMEFVFVFFVCLEFMVLLRDSGLVILMVVHQITALMLWKGYSWLSGLSYAVSQRTLAIAEKPVSVLVSIWTAAIVHGYQGSLIATWADPSDTRLYSQSHQGFPWIPFYWKPNYIKIYCCQYIFLFLYSTPPISSHNVNIFISFINTRKCLVIFVAAYRTGWFFGICFD